jgi:acyl carrier protein
MQPNDIPTMFTGLLAAAANVNPAEVSRDKRLREDLGLDSLSLVDIAVAAEDAFGISISDEKLERFQTVGDVIDCLGRSRRADWRRCTPSRNIAPGRSS